MSEPKRIQLSRKKGWRKPDGAVVVSRPSAWGNPYLIDADCQHLSWFRADLLKEATAQHGPTEPDHPWSVHFWKMARRLPDLRGRDLACWCPLDQPCHADVLLELANAPSPPMQGEAPGRKEMGDG